MGFLVKLFSIKGNLVFMNKLYHKVAVVSVCTALGFALGTNKEAKAAYISLAPTSQFSVVDQGNYPSEPDGLGDWYINPQQDDYGKNYLRVEKTLVEQTRVSREIRAFYEFNIANLSPTTNTVISRAILEAYIPDVTGSEIDLQLFGYIEPIEIF